MPWYVYRGINPTGHEVSGEEFGNNEGDIANRLLTNGISVIQVKVKTTPLIDFDLGKIFGRVSRKELKFFYLNLATLINSGCSLRSSISSLAEQAENQYFKKVLTEITASIEAGKSFSDSVKLHQDVFPNLFSYLVKAGEEGGMLDNILLRFSALVEKQEKIRGRIRGALVLPILMVVVALLVVVGLMVKVFPQFMTMFKGKEKFLPTETKIVMGISNFFVDQYKLMIGQQGWGTLFFRFSVLLAIVYGIVYFFRQPFGHRLFSRVQLKLPLLGSLFRKIYIASFTRTLGALLRGGVPALQALTIARSTIPNIIIQDAIQQIHNNVEKGGTFADPMYQNRFLFPKMVVLMVQVGETAGKTDEMLEKISEYYDAEVDETISALVTAIEPLMILFMGGFVLLIAASLFFPLFNLKKLLK